MPNKTYSNSNVVLTFEFFLKSIELIGNLNLTIKIPEYSLFLSRVPHGADHEGLTFESVVLVWDNSNENKKFF